MIHYLSEIEKNKITVIVRTKSNVLAERVINNSIKAGFKNVEITLTIENAYELIKKMATKYPDVHFGAGTVLTIEDAKRSLEAGANYLVSPILNLDLLKWTIENNVLLIPGVYSPSEIYKATSNGAKIVKLYPSNILTPKYLKIVLNPLKNTKVLCTGGINLDNMLEFFNAGAVAVGVSDNLGQPNENVSDDEIYQLAKNYLNKLELLK
ncbi:MAG: bifunctional 4-hydroxy-2-oxoglutarate aldolase/2-dehydro-3-deoxy-phosphogluconate aldolase [Mycoplasma sp.]|nr:bifunctional 4-hydroxy-2-oxoglutarate aldolase/2-dehydro-3-deoxy-phosphogluconate aldolase [Mycoplasma sp.]